MPRKRYRPEEIIAKLRQAEVLINQGKKMPEVIKAIGVSEVSYYRWRKEYGGLNVSQAKRLKELERENTRLRRAVSDLTLDKLILQEAARGNF
jgi:transposase-like protein